MPLNIDIPCLGRNSDRRRDSSPCYTPLVTNIGTPTNFKHNVQVKHDKERNEFVGLPSEWRILLDSNKICFDSNEQTLIETRMSRAFEGNLSKSTTVLFL